MVANRPILTLLALPRGAYFSRECQGKLGVCSGHAW
jgi:hypothetical protein